MSQNDYVIANQTTPLFRSDLNSALQALASNSSGATAPTTTYANMLWYDTTTNILKMRTEADDAWINVGYLDQSSNAFRIFDDTQVVDTSGTQTGLIGNQSTAIWEAGTSTTESLVSPAKVRAAAIANNVSTTLFEGIIQTSQTITFDKSGTLDILAIGGGGAGGFRKDVYGAAAGGASGATCIKQVSVNAGDTFTFTIGAGGTAPTTTASGGAGGNTTVTGPNSLNMVAGGGGGGGSVSPGVATGGAGAAATGGDVNLSGQSAGSPNALDTTAQAVSSGGVPIYFVGQDGTSVGMSTAAYAPAYTAVYYSQANPVIYPPPFGSLADPLVASTGYYGRANSSSSVYSFEAEVNGVGGCGGGGVSVYNQDNGIASWVGQSGGAGLVYTHFSG